jgi:hypothetical protein
MDVGNVVGRLRDSQYGGLILAEAVGEFLFSKRSLNHTSDPLILVVKPGGASFPWDKLAWA